MYITIDKDCFFILQEILIDPEYHLDKVIIRKFFDDNSSTPMWYDTCREYNGVLVIECDDDSFPKYLYFPSLDDYFNIPFYVYRDPIEAYVKVVRVNGELEYYISMTDKKYGFPETKFDDVKIESIVEFKELDKSYESGNICYFKRSA